MGEPSPPPSGSTKHRFWSTQPVVIAPSEPSHVATNEPLEKGPLDLRPEPYSLPAGFDWCILDCRNKDVLNELYFFMLENYVEDQDSRFRFAYSPEMIFQFMTAPDTPRDWQIGVRATASGKLLATIASARSRLRISGVERDIVEIDFLCVIRKLRTRRLAPVLIKEMVRRVSQQGITQAFFTGGLDNVPGRFTRSLYWHRPLKVEKLIETGFISAPRNVSIESFSKVLKVKQPSGFVMRRMKKADAPQVCQKLNDFSKRFAVSTVFNESSVEHWFLSHKKNVYAYVGEESDGEISFFGSFYVVETQLVNSNESSNPGETVFLGENEKTLNDADSAIAKSHQLNQSKRSSSSSKNPTSGAVSESSIKSIFLKKPQPISLIRVAYAYHYFYPYSDNATVNKKNLSDMFKCLLSFAAEGASVDVFNALEIMDNKDILEDLKFCRGDGHLNFYLYNWSFPPLEPQNVSTLLF